MARQTMTDIVSVRRRNLLGYLNPGGNGGALARPDDHRLAKLEGRIAQLEKTPVVRESAPPIVRRERRPVRRRIPLGD